MILCVNRNKTCAPNIILRTNRRRSFIHYKTVLYTYTMSYTYSIKSADVSGSYFMKNKRIFKVVSFLILSILFITAKTKSECD